MNSYEGMSDEELIQCLRNGRPEITDFIMEKYKNLVRKRANAMFLIGGETEDLIQEGMIGLFKAIRDYRPEKESSFYHFADLCITRQIYHAVEASQRKKHQPLNSYISLNIPDKDQGGALFDMWLAMDSANPEQLLIDRENVMAMEEKITHSLSRLEREVMEYHLQGLNYHQIAELLGRQPKAVDNALQRIKGKLGGIRGELR